eukprot:CAMPEP_0178908544 /NCGR_PEP_ID=MMETSP0786-20121207/7980_1 /TAXON_ID=186022 /ORGANISM="Thalassionema frauenfeldii, Strain CCMP 1798" /LENGTH=164 /DNA_ID=CAMNT_0020580455 /DNA_START=372 /DNA_END=866 /DNA_ORIENTATION=-
MVEDVRSCLVRNKSEPINHARKSVSFDSISVREYDRCIDLNPAVPDGPAIGLGWQFNEAPPSLVDDFESKHPPRREFDGLKLDKSAREVILREFGYERAEILKGVRKVNIARNQRKSTLAMQEHENLHLTVEKVKKQFKKCLGVRSSYSTEEKNLWKHAQNVHK